MNTVWLIGMAFFLIGMFFVVAGGNAMRLQAEQDNRQMVEAEGLVVKSELEIHDMANHRSRLYTPTVQYTDFRGERHEVKARYSCYPEKFHVGDRIEIRYDMLDMEEMELKGENRVLRICGLMFVAFGTLFSVTGAGLLIYACFI